METLDLNENKLEKYPVVEKIDYYTQIVLFWTIIGCAVTLYGIFIGLLLMIPMGIIQIASATYYTLLKKDGSKPTTLYRVYWALVGLVILVFTSSIYINQYKYQTATYISGMVLSLIAGILHTYIRHRDHKRKIALISKS